MTCTHCGAVKGQGALSCPSCGFIGYRQGLAAGLECENHERTAATAACVLCGRPVCENCAVQNEGKFFCNCAGHYQIEKTWHLLCVCESEFEADILVSNLKHAGIESRVFSLRDHISTFWVSTKPAVHVRVPLSMSDKAKEILDGLGLPVAPDSDQFD